MSTTYTWNDGATNISKSYTGFKNGSTFPSVYTKPGKYKVTVTAKNTAGSQTASHTIKVQGRFYILSILGAGSAYVATDISLAGTSHLPQIQLLPCAQSGVPSMVQNSPF